MIFESSAERIVRRQALEKIMIDLPVGQILANELIKSIAGTETMAEARQLYYAAHKVVNRENGLLFENVRGLGYEKLMAEDMHKTGVRARNFIRKKSKRSGTALKNANKSINSWDPLMQREIAQLGIIERFAGRVGEKIVATKMHEASSQSTAQDVANEFLKNLVRQRRPRKE